MRISTVRQLFGNRNFALFTVGNVLSLTGNWIQLVAVSWLIWELTHSTAWLGIMAASQFIPVFLVGPIGGVLADRLDRRRIIIFSNSGGLLCSLFLFVIHEAGGLSILVLFVQFRRPKGDQQQHSDKRSEGRKPYDCHSTFRLLEVIREYFSALLRYDRRDYTLWIRRMRGGLEKGGMFCGERKQAPGDLLRWYLERTGPKR